MEAGINYFDTAPSYGRGQSEQNLGQVLRQLNAEVYVGTKVRVPPEEFGDLRSAITRSVEASLQRLGRDSVDLIQLHNHIARQRDLDDACLSVGDVLSDVVPTFQSLQAQGKVKYYGITALGETAALHEVIDSGALYTAQVCYNLLNPSAGHWVPTAFPNQDFEQLIDRATSKQMGCIGIRVLAAGALSGVMERHPIAVPTVDPIGTGPDYQADVKLAQSLSFLTTEGHAASLPEAAMRFAWSHVRLSTVLVGFSSHDHLEEAIAAAERGALPAAAIDRLQQAWQAFPSVLA
jgi:L-galactose dehydrogenase/L-glyceraldehyde 3-phosphate reductase